MLNLKLILMLNLKVDTDVAVDAGVDFHESGPAVLLGKSRST